MDRRGLFFAFESIPCLVMYNSFFSHILRSHILRSGELHVVGRADFMASGIATRLLAPTSMSSHFMYSSSSDVT